MRVKNRIFSVWWGVAALTAVVAPSVHAAPIGYSVQSNGNDHLYSIDLATGTATDLGAVGLNDAEGLTFVGGQLYAIGGTEEEFWNITTPPGALVGATGSRAGLDAGLAASPTGSVYNIQGEGGQSSLYSINVATGAATLVGSDSTNFGDSLAINNAGAAYAVDGIFDDSLYTVDLATGALTLVGGLGLGNVSFQTGLSFDGNGTLWMLTSDSNIYTVNTATGIATFVASVRSVTGAPLSGFEGLAIASSVAPEPASILLLGTGALGLLARARRRKTFRAE